MCTQIFCVRADFSAERILWVCMGHEVKRQGHVASLSGLHVQLASLSLLGVETLEIASS